MRTEREENRFVTKQQVRCMENFIRFDFMDTSGICVVVNARKSTTTLSQKRVSKALFSLSLTQIVLMYSFITSGLYPALFGEQKKLIISKML